MTLYLSTWKRGTQFSIMRACNEVTIPQRILAGNLLGAVVALWVG